MLPWLPYSVIALIMLGVVGLALAWPEPQAEFMAIAVVVALLAFLVVGLPPDAKGFYPGAYWGLVYAPMAIAFVPVIGRLRLGGSRHDAG
jgi:hypothetical protein